MIGTRIAVYRGTRFEFVVSVSRQHFEREVVSGQTEMLVIFEFSAVNAGVGNRRREVTPEIGVASQFGDLVILGARFDWIGRNITGDNQRRLSGFVGDVFRAQRLDFGSGFVIRFVRLCELCEATADFTCPQLQPLAATVDSRS